MNKKSNLSTLMKYSGKYRIFYYIARSFAGLSAVFTLLPFWFIWKIVSEAITKYPNLTDSSEITKNAYLALLSALCAITFYILSLLCAHLNAFRIATNMRIELIRHITYLTPGEKDRLGSGALRRIISDSSEATETYLAHQLPDQTKSLVMFIGLLVLMFTCDWKLALFCLIPAVIGFMSIMSMAGKGLREKMTQYQNALSDMSNEAVEYIRGVPVIKTFSQSVFSFKRFKDSIDRYSKWASDYTKKVRLPIIIYTLAVNSVFVFLILASELFTKNGITDEFLLYIVFFIIISPIITGMLTSIMSTNETKMKVEDALTRMNSVMAIQPMISGSNKTINDSSIEFKDVCFGYEEEKEVLHKVNFKVPAGKTYAFVGPSGGGKSTIAALSSRFYDTWSGEVLIGGENIKNIDKEVLMNNISFVFQNSKLIHGSILDNIRLGNPDASEEDVKNALETARCMDIIDKFEDGINTIIGSEGIYLSGGEQQRLTIARAVLKNSPILILDEATAFADPDNENKIQEALSHLAKDKTVIIIAHRLSTVTNADKICVVNDGKIVEMETFENLKNKNGIFTSMWQEYTKSVEWRF